MRILVDLDRTIDGPQGKVAREEANCACAQEVDEARHEHIGKIDEAWNEGHHLHARDVIEAGVHENVERRAPRDEERAPPPPVVLAAEQEVDDHNGDFHTGNDQDGEHNCHKAVEIVELVLPN